MASFTNLFLFPISDVHLEFRKNKVKSFDVFIPFVDEHKLKLISQFPYETCLIIAGDLGYPSHQIYYDFLKYCKTKFNHVILTSGNHEYYKQKGTYVSTEIIDTKITEICRELGCVFLQQCTTQLDVGNRKLTFAGCTLWSFIPPDKEIDAQLNMNDFSHLMTPAFKFWTCADFNQMHKTHSEWLKFTLESQKVDVVVTHHLPTSDLIDPVFKKFQKSSLNCCYASDCVNSMNVSNVSLWICGHSHHAVETKNETTFIVNPLGYPGEKTGFNKEKYFIV